MSWLSEVKREFKYECSKCHARSSVVLTAKEHEDARLDGEICGRCDDGVIRYQGFSNVPASEGGFDRDFVTRESYEQNGRKAVKIGSKHFSQTKLNYMETGVVESALTSDYKAKVENDLQKQIQKTNLEIAKRL